MTLDQSIDLIEDTILGAPSGEIWLPKLKSMNILDLARIFANRYEVEFNVSGMRPGEKLHEELVSEPESIRVFDSGKYLQMRPSLSSISAGTKIFNYSSKDFLMDINGLEEYLNELKIFDQSLDSFVGREIEEIALPRGNK
jgi:FlaA1/EpsC-like NDP-sugar epimerase